MAQTGSYSLEDLLAYKNASAASFGLNTISEVLQKDLAAYNAYVANELSELCMVTDKQQAIYGVGGMLNMVEVDPFGAAPSKKVNNGVTVGFPLKLFSVSLGWTSKFLEIATPAEIANQYVMARRGHIAAIQSEIQKALFFRTNFTFIDRLTNGVSLAVKRLANADSGDYPAMPDGSAVAGSHDHYNYRASTLAASDITAAIADVTEHGYTKGIKLVINLADKAAITALSTSFTANASPLVDLAASAAVGKIMLTDDLQNQMIGVWDKTVEVWVKPWGLANYPLVYAAGEPEKPLAFRQREQDSLKGLRLNAQYGDYPLIAQTMDAEFGFGVFNRLAAAVCYIGNTSWSDPS
jgi:hypothetical protein